MMQPKKTKKKEAGAKEEEAGAKEDDPEMEKITLQFKNLNTAEKKFLEYLQLKKQVEEHLQPLNLTLADAYNLHQRIIYGKKAQSIKRMEKALEKSAKEERDEKE